MPRLEAVRPLALLVALALLAVATPALGNGTSPRTCPPKTIARGDACVAKARVVRDIRAIVRRTMRSERQQAAIYSVRVGGRHVVTDAEGESMTGVPATPAMNWRIGSIAFPLLGTLALQLQEDGIVDLDEPIRRYRPELPNADRVTLRMLLDGTSGYQDYVSDPRFVRAVTTRPFRAFSEAQLLRYAFLRPVACDPGECWTYSHANFVIAQQILAEATGTSFATLLRRRVLAPSRLRRTRSGTTPQIPRPVLHAYTTQDGVYQESTFWNPSWTTGRGAVLTSRIPDVARIAGVIGSGRLLSRDSFAQLVAPTTQRFAPWSETNHYGLGVFVINGWLVQNPSFSGYAGAMAYLPGARIAIAVTSTQARGADPDANVASEIMERVGRYLAPGVSLA